MYIDKWSLSDKLWLGFPYPCYNFLNQNIFILALCFYVNYIFSIMRPHIAAELSKENYISITGFLTLQN